MTLGDHSQHFNLFSGHYSKFLLPMPSAFLSSYECAERLVTDYREGGGLHNGRGACEVLPLQKGGGGGFF